jgi:antitoxin VapB
MIDIYCKEAKMDVAKVFQTGRSQAVRLPKAYRFNSSEVAIKSFGRGVLLLPIENPWDIMLEAVNEFEAGFQLERADQSEQLREDFK